MLLNQRPLCFNTPNCLPLSVSINLESCISIFISLHMLAIMLSMHELSILYIAVTLLVIHPVKALEDALLQVVKDFWLCLLLPPFFFNWFLWSFTSDSSESFLHSTYRCECILCFNQNYLFGSVFLLYLR